MLRPALLVIALLTLAGCGGDMSGGGGVTAGSGTNAPATAGATLEGETLDGGALSLADLRGKPIFVNVWASW